MNGYLAYYKNKKIEVFAETAYQAQKKASEILKVKKSHEVDVYLCEVDSKPVIHTPTF